MLLGGEFPARQSECRRPHALPCGRVVEQGRDPVRESRGIARLGEPAGFALMHGIANAADVERNHRLAAGHGFEDGVGLNERLLAIIENYIGLPVQYRGVAVRRDQKGGEQLETRLWHRDGEDKRIVKIIVYLNDVDRGGGAYEFIPRPSAPALWRTAPLGNRIDERTMSRFVPETAWRPCNGPRGTVVFTDTCSVFHRGQVAHSEDRRTLFFAYNSTSPRMPQSCAPMFDRARLLETEKDLSEMQLAAIGL